MTIKEFINCAIEGGWIPDSHNKKTLNESVISEFGICWAGNPFSPTVAEIVIDPKSWEAVGKVKGWAIFDGYDSSKVSRKGNYNQRMHNMIDHLCNDGTIESYLMEL